MEIFFSNWNQIKKWLLVVIHCCDQMIQFLFNFCFCLINNRIKNRAFVCFVYWSIVVYVTITNVSMVPSDKIFNMVICNFKIYIYLLLFMQQIHNCFTNLLIYCSYFSRKFIQIFISFSIYFFNWFFYITSIDLLSFCLSYSTQKNYNYNLIYNL